MIAWKVLKIVCLGAALACAGVSAALAIDVSDDFSTNPAVGGRWALGTGWTWSATGKRIVSSPLQTCTARWLPNSFSTGVYSARIKLLASGSLNPAQAQLVFAWQTAPNPVAYRFVTLLAGAPGTVILGQKGIIGATPGTKVLASVPLTIKLGTWYRVAIVTHPGGRVDVYLAQGTAGSSMVLSYTGLPKTTGSLGFRTSLTQAQYDDFAFSTSGRPTSEVCAVCHAGNPAPKYLLAPNVMAYWDGSWWDGGGGPGTAGDTIYQQGGHGDPDGRPAVTCAGTTGCHDMTQSADTHADGLLYRTDGGPNLRTGNTYHLRAGFINPAPVNAWDVQVTFDNYCYTACHQGYGVADHRHNSTPPNVVQFGNGHTPSNADGGSPRPVPYPVDSDLTTLASRHEPDYAPCVSCHDPHGTGVTDGRPFPYFPSEKTNRMLRADWFTSSILCITCHSGQI